MPSKRPTRQRTSNAVSPDQIVDADGRVVDGPPVVMPLPPIKDRSWHENFIKVIATTGNVGFACRAMKVSRSTYNAHLLKYPTFARAIEDANKDFADLILDEGLKRVRAGSDVMIGKFLVAFRPEFAPKTQVEHRLSDVDRRLIAKMAADAGVDPDEIMREVESVETRRGRIRPLPAKAG